MEMPKVGEDEILTFDWDDEQIDNMDKEYEKFNDMNTGYEAPYENQLEQVNPDLLLSQSTMVVEKAKTALDNPSKRIEAKSITGESAISASLAISNPNFVPASVEEMSALKHLVDSPMGGLRERLSVTVPTIIFTNSIKSAKFVHLSLKEAAVSSVMLHGLTDPQERNKVLSMFASGTVPLMITTRRATPISRPAQALISRR